MKRNIGMDKRAKRAIPASNTFLEMSGFIHRNATVSKRNKGTRKWAVAYAYKLKASKVVPARNQSGFRLIPRRHKKARENTKGKRLASRAHRDIMICHGLMARRNNARSAVAGEKSFLAIPYTITNVSRPEINIGKRITTGDNPKGTNEDKRYE